MSKYENPVRGVVHCPVCVSLSTVHQVGEGKLIAEGEPPKNGRNLGLKYYRCPKCGNSSMSKSVDEYVDKHMATDESALLEREASALPVLVEALDVTELTVSDSIETVEPLRVEESSTDRVESIIETETPTDKPLVEIRPFVTVKRVLMVLGVVLACLWAVRLLLPKPQPEESTDATTG
ncbi:hypothetical protein [Vibrio ordalii]|uniref:Uncharacterized protein n=1 Tax=Vibrio ordalii FS-238 TaxID=617133 RepID=A0A853R7Y5_9VIBR|nr:hypothetical protein [Vibrio ordalii]OEE40762.1 hypothetical protein A1QS_13940 [Vibrio ordalii FS-238]